MLRSIINVLWSDFLVTMVVFFWARFSKEYCSSSSTVILVKYCDIFWFTRKISRTDSSTPLMVVLLLVIKPLQRSILFTTLSAGFCSKNSANIFPFGFLGFGSLFIMSGPKCAFESICITSPCSMASASVASHVKKSQSNIFLSF